MRVEVAALIRARLAAALAHRRRLPTALLAHTRWLPTALLAGIAAAAVSGSPATAADTAISAQIDDTWKPSAVTITAGDSVTWSNPTGGFHNVCVLKPGGSGDSCSGNSDAEFRNGDPSGDWSSYTNSFTFTTPGTYQFFCEAHRSLGMTGTITVQAASTGTSTTPPPIDTTTTPTTMQQQATPPADTTAPRFLGKPKRRPSHTSIELAFRTSEAGKLRATVLRRAQHAHRYSRIGAAVIAVHRGRNVIKLPRKASGRLRPGAYRVRLQLVDAAGNHSSVASFTFTAK